MTPSTSVTSPYDRATADLDLPRHPEVRRPVGRLLVGTTVVNSAAVAVLSAVFGWPAVLDEPAQVALTAFAADQPAIVGAFYAFALMSLLLIPISLGLYLLTARRSPLLAASVAAAGVLAGVFQVLGWIRWAFVVPDLAHTYLDADTDETTRAATAATYELINSYAGGALGEHVGWLLQGSWGLGIAVVLLRSRVGSRALAITGGVLTAVWMPLLLLPDAVPALADGPLGTLSFVAYALWFVWNAALGVALLRDRTAA